MSTFYKEALNYYDLQTRRPMSLNYLTDRGARQTRASDANIRRNRTWEEHRNDITELLNSTFHNYELDRQMPLWWLAKFDFQNFMHTRDSEINKGQGRVEKNHMYKEVAYQYLMNMDSIDHSRLIMPNTNEKARPSVSRKK